MPRIMSRIHWVDLCSKGLLFFGRILLGKKNPVNPCDRSDIVQLVIIPERPGRGGQEIGESIEKI